MRATTTAVTKEDVEAFLNSCVMARASYTHHRILFDCGTERLSMLNEIAPIFFGDLHALLRDTIYLSVCRLTDPEKTGQHDNLTVAFLAKKSVGWLSQELEEIQSLCDQIDQFRKKIEPARNKRIGHLDRTAAVGGEPLGAAPMEDWETFWINLGKFLALFHHRYIGGGRFDLNDIAVVSDGDSLVKALKESRYFHEIIKDHSLTTRCADIAFASKYWKI